MISNFNKTILHLAVENENIEMVELLLTCDKLDINIHNILMLDFLIKFFLSIISMLFLYSYYK